MIWETIAAPPGPAIPPEAQAELVHDMLDRQYRSLLDEPVPMLGNRTPRAAAGNNHFLEVRRTSRSLTLRTCHLVGAATR